MPEGQGHRFTFVSYLTFVPKIDVTYFLLTKFIFDVIVNVEGINKASNRSARQPR